MDTLKVSILGDAASELNCIQQPTPCVDLTDTPITPQAILPGIQANPNLLVTSPVSEHSYYDLQFMMANNYWGVNFNFGNDPAHSACVATPTLAQCAGLNIRQGIAHLIDRAKFTSTELLGSAVAIDSPVPPSNGGLLSPNTCAWDILFPESGANCVVGGPGGTAYHLQGAGGVNYQWQPSPGSQDFCAAARHFIDAGLASGNNTTTCVLTGISSMVTAHTVNIFVRNDDPVRLDLGRSIAQEICGLFGQGFVSGCSPFLTETEGRSQTFPGFNTCSTICTTWWIYTGAFRDVFPFDASLYYIYNSRFVSGGPSIQPPNGPCSSASVPSSGAPNYMYLCNQAYDLISNQMEFAPCLSSAGDPAPGSSSNGPGANCPGVLQLSAISAGVLAEDAYGNGSFSIPVFDRTDQFAYLSNWQRIINGDGTGIPNFFTWLDGYSPNPAVPGTIRQGFSEAIRSLNPYIASTTHDFYILNNIYDRLIVANPTENRQSIDWAAIQGFQLPNSQLTYIPPPGTVQNFRFVLRPDLYFQNGNQVTSFDVAFSYLSMIANGAFQSASLSSVTGITVLGPTAFDINVNSLGPFTLTRIASPLILPGRYWTGVGSGTWDSALTTCTRMGAPCYPAQYTLGPPPVTGPAQVVCNATYSCTFPAVNLNADPAKTVPTFDPLSAGILIGSGPFECNNPSGTSLGTGCSSSATQSPPVGGTLTLSRFGKGFAPSSPPFDVYFRSAGNLAAYVWTGDNGIFTHDFVNFAVVGSCYNRPVGTVGCTHWQEGIGNPNGPNTVSINQVLIVARFAGLSWLSPFDWVSSPPAGIGFYPPVLYEAGMTLTPHFLGSTNPPGCALSENGGPPTPAYPNGGGYNC